jgi:hypothetical protein
LLGAGCACRRWDRFPKEHGAKLRESAIASGGKDCGLRLN